MKADVVVVGGGIAGLAAAYRLQQAGLDAVLLERTSRIGGKLQTERVNGFVVEAGPDSFLTTKPGAIDLARRLGMGDELHAPSISGASVMKDGRLYPLPQGLSGLVPARLGPLLMSPVISPAGRLRLGLERLIPARRSATDESLAGFMRRRFGREAYGRLIEPLMSGIYAGDGDQLSLTATFPQLRSTEMARGSLMRAFANRPRPAGSPFLAPQSGIAALSEALEAALVRVDLRRETTVTAIRRSGTDWVVSTDRGGEINSQSVILAVPAYDAADALTDTDSELAAILRLIPYVSVATVSLAYRASDVSEPLKGSGYVVPRRENRPIIAATWMSNKWAHRAPPGHVLVRAFLGRAGRELILENSNETLIDVARAEMAQVLGASGTPILQRVFRFPRGMPQYNLGHTDRLRRIERRLAQHPGLYLAGHAYRGVGIPDCIISGEAAAVSAIERAPAKSPTT